MNDAFQRAMAEATRLTRAGELQAATALIQAALHANGLQAAPFASARPQASVIDIQARVVDGDASAALSHSACVSTTKTSATPVREVLTPRPDHSASPSVGDDPLPQRPVRDIARRVFSALRSVVPPLDRFTEPLAPRPSREPDTEPFGPGEGRFIDGSHTEAAGTRAYKLFVPPERHGKELPLVVMLHGCTQHPDDFAAGTGMNEAARKQGFYVLYPAQCPQMNPQRCWNWFKHSHQVRGRGEAALLAGMTRRVILQHGIDPRCVYVAGLSAGGAMAAVLGSAYPDMFAAVGVHSGLPAGVARDLPTALAAMQGNGPAAAGPAPASPPTIVFHGDRDSTVHPINGEHAVAVCAGTAVASEIEHGRSRGGRAYTRRIWRNAGGQPAAEHWSVHGAGHAWSGGCLEGSYTDEQGPDATDAMLRFFLTHRLYRCC